MQIHEKLAKGLYEREDGIASSVGMATTDMIPPQWEELHECIKQYRLLCMLSILRELRASVTEEMLVQWFGEPPTPDLPAKGVKSFQDILDIAIGEKR